MIQRHPSDDHRTGGREVHPVASEEECMLASTLIEVGNNHRLDDPEPLEAMMTACETA